MRPIMHQDVSRPVCRWLRCPPWPLAVCALLWLAFSASVARAEVFVPTNSVWRFFRGLSEPTANVTEWRTNTFDDSSWELGPALFYFGYSPASGTLLSDMRTNYTSLFLRSAFVLSNAA